MADIGVPHHAPRGDVGRGTGQDRDLCDVRDRCGYRGHHRRIYHQVRVVAILAVDPGLTTGFSIYRPRVERLALRNQGGEEDFESHQFSKEMFLHEWLPEAVKEFDTIVCENFIITAQTAKKSQAPWSLEQIGVLRWLATQQGARFVLQKPAEALAFGSDAKLKKLGWYKRGRGHANDAARHMVLYTVRKGLVDPALFLTP